MANTFSFNIKGNMQTTLDKVNKLAREEGMHFAGDAKSGSFDGKGVVGTYTVDGSMVSITIVKKPFWAPISMIEGKIRDFFA